MPTELRRSGHPMPATLLTVSLSGPAQAELPMTDPSTVLPPPPPARPWNRSRKQNASALPRPTSNRFLRRRPMCTW